MSIIQAILLGALQGVAEFLPISSSGHLVLMKQMMELQEVPALFDVLLHVATLAVVLIVFRNIVGRLLVSLGRWIARKSDETDRDNLRLIVTVLIATFFTGVLGFGIEKLDPGSNTKLVSGLFILTGILLISTKWAHGNHSYDKTGWKEGVITGIAQGFGVFPGISRSGITISAALWSGMSREKAGEFSFLISIPAIVGALILEFKDFSAMNGVVSGSALASGMISAFVVGLVSLILLLKVIRSGRLYLFSIYLIPAGIAGLIWL